MRGQLLGNQTHARFAVLVTDRPLDIEEDKNARTQHPQQSLGFGQDRLRGADEELEILLRLAVALEQFLADGIKVGGVGPTIVRLSPQFLGADAQPTPTRMFGQHPDRALGIIARRQGMLGTGEGVLAAAEHEVLADFLGLLFRLGQKGRNQIAKVFRTGLIAVLGSFIGV